MITRNLPGGAELTNVNIEDIKTTLKSKVSDNDFLGIFDRFKENVNSSTIKDQLIILESRYNSLQSKKILGTVKDDYATIELNGISQSVLKIINGLKQEHCNAGLATDVLVINSRNHTQTTLLSGFPSFSEIKQNIQRTGLKELQEKYTPLFSANENHWDGYKKWLIDYNNASEFGTKELLYDQIMAYKGRLEVLCEGLVNDILAGKRIEQKERLDTAIRLLNGYDDIGKEPSNNLSVREISEKQRETITLAAENMLLFVIKNPEFGRVQSLISGVIEYMNPDNNDELKLMLKLTPNDVSPYLLRYKQILQKHAGEFNSTITQSHLNQVRG